MRSEHTAHSFVFRTANNDQTSTKSKTFINKVVKSDTEIYMCSQRMNGSKKAKLAVRLSRAFRINYSRKKENMEKVVRSRRFDTYIQKKKQNWNKKRNQTKVDVIKRPTNNIKYVRRNRCAVITFSKM